MREQEYMQMAIELAKKGEGHVNPNPLVGAVVVKDDKIIGRGYHKFFGGPHAEVYALEEAGEFANGATLYVTLEPCSHFGKTPPCVNKIINSGIKKCYVAIEDPNPLVAGNGIKLLREKGIEVEVGLCEKEARDLNRIFLKYIKEKIPFLFVKCGITLDGKIATKTFNSKWITNSLSRQKVQELRNKHMGIMVGINTVLRDNPSLDARVENAKNPYRIVVDPYLEIDIDSKLLKFDDKKVIIITSSEERNNIKKINLEKNGIKFIELEGRKFSFAKMLKELGSLGIDSVLLEGGGNLISSAFKEKAIDGGEIFIAPKIIGDSEAIPMVSGFDINNLDEAINLENVKINSYGNNCSMEFYR